MTAKPASDALDRDKLLSLLHQHPGRKFSTVDLQRATEIDSSACYRALHSAPGVQRDGSGCPTWFWVSA